MGFFDKILDGLKIDEPKKKTSLKKINFKLDGEDPIKEKSAYCNEKTSNPSGEENGKAVSSPDSLIDTKIKETVEELIKEKDEIIKLFDNNFHRIQNMGNTLICQSSDSDHECLIWDIIKCYSPNHLKLLMMDETGIVYSSFQETPYLFVPVISDQQKFTFSTKWLFEECLDRFNKFK